MHLSIADLVTRFGSAKATVEKALGILRDEGLIVTRQGSPTVVAAKPADSEEAEAAPQERSEEFQVLFSYLQEIRGQLRRMTSAATRGSTAVGESGAAPADTWVREKASAAR